MMHKSSWYAAGLGEQINVLPRSRVRAARREASSNSSPKAKLSRHSIQQLTTRLQCTVRCSEETMMIHDPFIYSINDRVAFRFFAFRIPRGRDADGAMGVSYVNVWRLT